MSLRRTLALRVLVVAIPLAGGLLWLRSELVRRNLDDALAEFALAYLQAGGRERCEADPSRFAFDTLGRPEGPGREGREEGPPDERPFPPPREGRRPPEDGRPPPGPRGHVPPTRLFLYRADLTSANPDAPPLPADLAEALRDGKDRAATSWRPAEDKSGRQVALRLPWKEGPCAVVLAQRLFPPELDREVALLVTGVGLLCLGLLAAMLWAAGALVRRIRGLEADVARAAASRYAEPVPVRGNDEVAGLAVAFNAAGAKVREQLEQVESREATLRRFVANTTHDVAIPLTVLQGHLARLLKAAGAAPAGAAAPVGETGLDLAKGALEEAHYLGCLLQNLSAVARLETGNVRLEKNPVDLNRLVERVVARHRALAEAAGVEMPWAVPPEPVMVTADVTLLEEAVSNVVHNAVRYGGTGGHAAVVLEAMPEAFVLRVFDDGPGIPDDELARVRRRGERGSAARTRHPHGAGLGLAIADEVVRLHGFALDLSKSEFGGLEVRFSGPRISAT